MPKKIDPLNKKHIGAVTASLCVKDVKAAAAFYQKALGFEKRSIMNGPDRKPIHAELRLRDTVIMLGPEFLDMGFRSAKTLGASPIGLYLMTENVDKVVAKALKLGATAQGPVADQFWGDRCGRIVDPEGYTWTIATHIAEPTPAEMKKKMAEEMKKWSAQSAQPSAATAQPSQTTAATNAS
ncbi:MAG: VOC family protein [Acidobacteriia bacterium]|nr:VOC family protein [Terriglobia bacterium]